MKKNKKQNRNRIRKNNIKLLTAGVVGVSAVTGVAPIGPIGQPDKAEAASDYIYYWDRWDQVSTGELSGGWDCNGESSSDGGCLGSWVPAYKKEWVKVGTVTSTNRYAYSESLYYRYSHAVAANQAPSVPTLTVPTQQFEHGDNQIIGWNATDPDGNALTYTLQVSYAGGAWENLYNGPNKSYTYQVPSNKGAKVKFRVTASDGSLTSTSAESTEKSIQAVMYYWSKYNTATNGGGYSDTSWAFSRYHQASDWVRGGTSYSHDSANNKYSIIGDSTVVGGSVYKMSGSILERYTYIAGHDIGPEFIVEVKDPSKNTKTPLTYARGTLIKNDVIGGVTAYTNNAKNADGFWYIKGQRVLDTDTTPPIIELTEPSAYGASASITVKTHDLGTVKTVKWAKGNQPVSYFTGNGTAIGIGQVTPSTFVATENGTYTVYAIDTEGNAAVQTIEVTKVNTAPSKPTLGITATVLEHDDEHYFSFDSTDAQNQPITYTLEASYDGGTYTPVYRGTDKTFKYKVPRDKGSKVKFRLTANDGQFDSEVTESSEYQIREVMYYWSKYDNKVVIPQIVSGPSISITPAGSYETPNPEVGSNYQSYNLIKVGSTQTDAFDLGNYRNYSITLRAGQTHVIYEGTAGTRFITQASFTRNLADTLTTVSLSTMMVTSQITTGTPYDTRGSLVSNNIEAGENAYNNNIKNADGYWYERGQRVLGEDATPPIIELEEQTSVGATSTVTVKTHDLSTVQTVKWAEGDKGLAYFVSGGTEIAVGQTTPSSFVVGTNEIYTVYAQDSKGNEVVKTIEVNKVNTAPEVFTVQASKSFDVLDDATDFSVYVGATDIDGQDLSSSATYAGSSTANSPNLQLTLNGTSYAKGVHNTPITIKVNDGIVDSAPYDLTDHIVIRVDDAAEYKRLLNGHTVDADAYTKAEHEAFYNAYEAVLAYENGHQDSQKVAAVNAIEQLKTATDVSSSVTTVEWAERLGIVSSKVALETAEQSLAKVDYDLALDFFNALGLQANKDLLQDRIDELTKFHDASELLVPMEAEVSRHKADPTNVLNTTIINMTNFGTAKASIELTQDTTEANYKAALTQRYAKLQSYYLNNKDNLTAEDLVGTHPDVDPTLTTEYDELKGAFRPIDENIEHLVHYTNSLVAFLNKVDQPTKDAYVSTVAALPRNTGIDFTELDKVTEAVESIYTFRSTFHENDAQLSRIELNIQAIAIGGTNTTGYMEEIRKAMKEVTEFNDVELDAEHNETEKQEALTQLQNLRVDSDFYKDMSDYLNNGIPVVMVDVNPYEYIFKDTLLIKGTVTDTNNTTHVITAELGTDKISKVTSNGDFEIEFTRPEGVYLTEPLTVNANDGLTNKAITISGKPIISVSDPVLFTQMVKLLENDRTEAFNIMSQATLEELLDIFNDMVGMTGNVSPVYVQGLYDQAKALSGKTNGELEVFIKQYAQANYLEWIYENYQTATIEDFEFAGVLKDGSPVVTTANIVQLKEIIGDYKRHQVAANLDQTPEVTDYLKWIEMLEDFEELDEMIDKIYDLTIATEVTEAIAKVAIEIDNRIPLWSGVRAAYEAKLDDARDFEKALIAVTTAETDYTQTAHDTATNLVTIVKDADAKLGLETRLVEVQKVVNVITAVELSEDTKDEADVATAQALLDDLQPSAKKTELQGRLDNVMQYDGARKSVVKAETDLTQATHDDAKTLVDALADGTLKSDLLDRLEEVQRIVDAQEGVAKAELSADLQDIADAQLLVDAVTTPGPKDDLQNRLSDVKKYAEAVRAVADAETNLDQTSKDAAQALVDILPASESRDRLEDRLKDVQQIIDASKLVADAELSKVVADVDTAQAEVDKIQNATEKEKLQTRIDEVVKYIEAEKAVKDAEDSNKQVDKDIAEGLVNLLPNGPDKDALVDRLVDVQDSIDKKSAEDKATDAVEKVETTWDQQDVIDARNLVDTLIDPTVKNDLTDRLNTVDTLMGEYETVKASVEKAEVSKLKDDVDEAQQLLTDLVTQAGKQVAKTDDLQTRIDEVNRYIEAEKAVTLAETSKYKRHVDEAQNLVDGLQAGVDQDFLLERLDILNGLVTAKPNDILDRIVDGVSPITEQELADYTGETVYKELLDDYLDAIREIADKTGNLTKEDVIRVIRLINTFEIAKRSMVAADITAYEIELGLVNNAIRSNYPTPQVMYATASYLEDDSRQMELAEGLALLLGRDVQTVLAEMEALLAGTEEVKTGFYSVQYIDVDTSEVLLNQPIEAEFGDITVVPNPQLEGYELVETEPVTFELNTETNGKVFTFHVKSTGDTAEVILGSYTVNYILEDGTVVDSELIENVELGETTVSPRNPQGYQLLDDTKLSVTLTEEDLNQVVTFVVQPVDPNTLPEEVATLGSYVVGYKTVEGELVKEVEFNDLALGEHEVTAELFDDYKLIANEAETKAITLTEEEPTQGITFLVEEPAVEPVASVNQYPTTVGEDSHIVKSLRVASLDNSFVTSTQVAVVPTVSHQQYLYQASQALMKVSAFVAKPTQQNFDSALGFVTSTLVDGSYKAQLLALLNYSIENIGEDGLPDLTPVGPYVPSIISRPTTPEPTAPADVDNGDSSSTPVVVLPSPLPIEVPKDTGTIAVDEKVHDVVVGEDGTLTWVIDNPLKTDYDLTSPSANVSIEFDKELINSTKKLEVIWKHLGKEHYQLTVLADGKAVSKFKAKLDITKTGSFAYMHLKEGNTYKATPYKYEKGKFIFNANKAGTFFFTKEKKTFKDITKFPETKDAIEELASRLIVNGTSKDKYSPKGKVTRAQFAAMLTRSLGLEASGNPTPFKDTLGKWHEKEVQALYEAGIISGTSATTFSPNSDLTREQAVAMLYKVLAIAAKDNKLELPPVKDTSFKDRNNISPKAKTAVFTLETLGLIQGSHGKFNPQETLTRAHLAKILAGTLKLTGDM